jgi:hypothetical protein
VSPWKVILATLVIFTAGLITGGVGVRQLSSPPLIRPAGGPVFGHWMLREEFIRQMAQQMNLTFQQQENISRIVRESQERSQILAKLIEPEMREELRQTREAIRAELGPRQRLQFDEFLRRRQQRRFDMPPPLRPGPGRPPPEGPRRGEEPPPADGFRRPPPNRPPDSPPANGP